MPPLPSATSLSGSASLLESHESRLQTLERTNLDVAVAVAAMGAKLQYISTTLEGIDSKIDKGAASLAAVTARVVDIEKCNEIKVVRTSQRNLIFWTAMATMVLDIILQVMQHVHPW